MKRESDWLEEQKRKMSQKTTEVDNVEKYIQTLKENQLCTDAFLIQKKKLSWLLISAATVSRWKKAKSEKWQIETEGEMRHLRCCGALVTH